MKVLIYFNALLYFNQLEGDSGRLCFGLEAYDQQGQNIQTSTGICGGSTVICIDNFNEDVVNMVYKPTDNTKNTGIVN